MSDISQEDMDKIKELLPKSDEEAEERYKKYKKEKGMINGTGR